METFVKSFMVLSNYSGTCLKNQLSNKTTSILPIVPRMDQYFSLVNGEK